MCQMDVLDADEQSPLLSHSSLMAAATKSALSHDSVNINWPSTCLNFSSSFIADVTALLRTLPTMQYC